MLVEYSNESDVICYVVLRQLFYSFMLWHPQTRAGFILLEYVQHVAVASVLQSLLALKAHEQLLCERNIILKLFRYVQQSLKSQPSAILPLVEHVCTFRVAVFHRLHERPTGKRAVRHRDASLEKCGLRIVDVAHVRFRSIWNFSFLAVCQTRKREHVRVIGQTGV